MLRILLIAAGMLLNASSQAADHFSAQEVQALESVVRCYSFRNWLVTTLTRACADFKPPASIALGQSFSERGTTHVINVIEASQVVKDDAELNMKKDDLYCVAAETPADLDFEGSAWKRVWLLIPKCRPIR
jgi:hypothetical protein